MSKLNQYVRGKITLVDDANTSAADEAYTTAIFYGDKQTGIFVIDQLCDLCEKKAETLLDLLNHTANTPDLNYLKIGWQNVPPKKRGL